MTRGIPKMKTCSHVGLKKSPIRIASWTPLTKPQYGTTTIRFEKGVVREIRDYPNDEEIVPLVKAMAKAVTRMPALKAMTVTGAVDGVRPDSIFELAFVAQGQSDIEDQRPEDTAKPRLYCRMGDWRPAEEAMECWRVAMPGLFVKFFL